MLTGMLEKTRYYKFIITV